MTRVTATKALNSSSARVWWSVVIDRSARLPRVISWVSQRRSSAARSRRSRAWRAYAQVSRKVVRNWPSPATIATLTAPATGRAISPGAVVAVTT